MGEGEGREGTALGVQSPQHTGAHRQRHITNEPGTHRLFPFDLNLYLDLRMDLVHDCLCKLYIHKPYKWAPYVSN
jgi:hypothetical protein